MKLYVKCNGCGYERTTTGTVEKCPKCESRSMTVNSSKPITAQQTGSPLWGFFGATRKLPTDKT